MRARAGLVLFSYAVSAYNLLEYFQAWCFLCTKQCVINAHADTASIYNYAVASSLCFTLTGISARNCTKPNQTKRFTVPDAVHCGTNKRKPGSGRLDVPKKEKTEDWGSSVL